MKEEPSQADHIATGHRNFVCDAIYYLYEDNRVAEAQKWYDYLKKTYPNKTILDKVPNSYPATLTLDQFAVGRVQEDVGDTSQDATVAAIEGLLVHAYEDLALGEDDRYSGFKLLAKKVWDNYEAKVEKYPTDKARTGLPPFKDLNNNVLNHLLDTQQGLPYAARVTIRTQLGMGPETTGMSTNLIAPEAVFSPTNGPATNSVAP